MKMEIQRERMESLPSRSPANSIKLTQSLSPPTLNTEDKDGIYTFSDECKSDNDDSVLNEIEKIATKNCLFDNDTDNNSNDTRSPLSHQLVAILKEGDNSMSEKPFTTPSTDHINKSSSSPLQIKSSTVVSPTAAQSPISRPNGNILSAGTTKTEIPKKILSGKPKAFALTETNKVSVGKMTAKTTRGRPKRKALVAMYQSQLTDNKIGIKIRLKKSLEAPLTTLGSAKKKSTSTGTAVASATATKSNRKRQRKSKQKDTSDSDDSEYEKRRRNNNTTSDKHKNRKTIISDDYTEPEEQSVWGSTIPEEILLRIFENAVNLHGCLPTIVNIGKVCSLWRRVSLDTKLWHTLDLSTWAKDRTELSLKYIIQNHLHSCKDINLSNWKVTNIDCVIDHLLEASPDLVGISLAGWKEFTGDQLAYLVTEFKSLRRIDLSSVNLELNPNRSAVGMQPLCSAIQTLGSRLTHLYLAHNRLAGIPQIVTDLSTHCPNLSLLDLSNVSTVAVSHGVLHIEKLQEGCPHLKVLRITNSHITLSTATLQEQMDSTGFPELEELSVASLADESRLMNDEFLQRILKTSTKLKLLDVRGCARLTHDTLIRLPTWDLKHLFLSGCSVTRDIGSGLELIASKWAHSLTEFDLAWANVQEPLDNAIKAIAEKGAESPLNHLNLCGSSVSLEAVKEILINCRYLNSINLASCRGLPRGVKRLLQGTKQIEELRDNLGVKLKGSPIVEKVTEAKAGK